MRMYKIVKKKAKKQWENNETEEIKNILKAKNQEATLQNLK